MILNPKTDKPASYSDNNNSSDAINIVRLVEDPKIKKKIRFDELSFDDYSSVIDVQGGNSVVNEFGITFPVIRINDVILSRFHIKSMTIDSSDILPTIHLFLHFESTAFIGKNMPKDGDMISLYLRTSTNALMYLRNDFIIDSCIAHTKSYNKSSTNVEIIGTMFIPGFNSHQYSKSYIGTTKDVIKDLAKEYKMGFVFNDFDDTNDFQNWLSIGLSVSEFLTHLAEHAWKDETSFFDVWVDLYYNICFDNVNLFLLTANNKEEVDVTFATDIKAIENLVDMNTDVSNAKSIVKILTNSTDYRGTPFYIKKWTPINSSTATSFDTGYSTVTYSFVHNQYHLNDNQSQCFQTLRNIPAYDPNKTDTHILLRGRATYDKNKNPENEKARVNHDFVNTYNTHEWVGVEYTLHDDDQKKKPNDWSGNVHKNYIRAPYHNKQNLDELDKIYLMVECEGLNLQIMRGERVPVYIVLNGTYDESSYNNASENDLNRNVDKFYTGYYIVDSVEISYRPGSGNITPYTTSYILKRREWSTPETI